MFCNFLVLKILHLTHVLHIFLQEYKVSNFEQRLMNEIEYRLERTPPVNEDPEDANFIEVPVSEQVSQIKK